MSGANSGSIPADVVAVFDTQTAANDAVYHLRLAGFGDDRIACYSRPPGHGLTDSFNRDYAFVGAVVGGAVGVMLATLLVPLVHQWSAWSRDVQDPFGLAATMRIVMALFFGLIGWGLGLRSRRPRVTAPGVDATVGPFVLAVAAGADRDRVWAVIRRAGGRDPASTVPAPAHH